MKRSLPLALTAALVLLAFAPPLSASTAALASGGSIAAWTVEPDLIYGQIMDASGQPAGPELLLAEGGTLERLAADPSGGFVLAWRSRSLDQVLVRRFDPAGSPVGETVLLAEEAEAGGLTRGPEILIHQASLVNSSGAEVAAAVRGTTGTLVAWVEDRVLSARVLVDSPLGSPLTGAVFRISPEGSLVRFGSAHLVARPGGFLAVWATEEAQSDVVARFLDPLGQPVGPVIPLIQGTGPSGAYVMDVEAVRGGGFLLGWYASSEDVRVRRFDAAGAPAGPEISLDKGTFPQSLAAGPDGGFAVTFGSETRVYRPDGSQPRPAITNLGGEIAADDAGRFVVAWTARSQSVEPDRIRFQRLSADGRLLGAPVTVDQAEPLRRLSLSDLSVRPDGSFLLLWSDFEHSLFPSDITEKSDALARAYNAAGEPLGPEIHLPDDPTAWDAAGKAAATPEGWTATWRSIREEGDRLYARSLSLLVQCAADRLCLNGQRFRVEVDWHVPQTGQSGAGRPLGLTGDTGAFWFFDPQNAELVVKVLDGSAVNGRFWVFYGSLTNVRFDLTVTDTLTGRQRVYRNPAGTLASRADTDAFPAGVTAGASILAPPAGLAAPKIENAEAACVEGGVGICLNGRRFHLDLDWSQPSTGLEGSGRPSALSDDTALFWFFDPSNIEVLVKVLDGTGVNGHFWVFYGTLTDLELDLTVTDTTTGAQRIYHKPAGSLASEADTRAFPQ